MTDGIETPVPDIPMAEPAEVKVPIGVDEIHKANEILQRYRKGRALLTNKIRQDEQWYQLRHWGEINAQSQSNSKQKSGQIQPRSAWLFNSLVNKDADAMDQFPCATCRPRESSDKAEAKTLTSILPVILDTNGFEDVYDAVQDSKFKYGVGVYYCGWNQDKLNGLGDIEVKRVDVLNLFWEPGVDDIQDSPNFFSLALENNEYLEARYPQLKDQLRQDATLMPEQYIDGVNIDLKNKTLVIDWYYKRWEGGRMVLHYCKYCGDEVLFSSENQPGVDEDGNPTQRGWYQHGMYPYVFDRLYRTEGSPCGVSIIDIGKSPQMFIDLMNKAFLENAVAGAKPRWLFRKDGRINEDEFLDLTNSLVHFDGELELNRSAIPLTSPGLSGTYVNVQQNAIEELKETSGNRDVSSGGTTGGVTAASAIAAMQEASAKLSRYASKLAYRAYSKLIWQVIELIREKYDMPRSFRILGPNSMETFIEYTNAKLKMQTLVGVDGQETYRLPQFDIEVCAQKKSPYNRVAQNEFAMELYARGFFNPAAADQVLVALEMMDFDNKDEIVQRVSQNGTLLKMLKQTQIYLLQVAAMLDQYTGDNLADRIAASMESGEGGLPNPSGGGSSGDLPGKEPATTRDARARVAQSTEPR